jgi:hypothetical protein
VVGFTHTSDAGDINENYPTDIVDNAGNTYTMTAHVHWEPFPEDIILFYATNVSGTPTQIIFSGFQLPGVVCNVGFTEYSNANTVDITPPALVFGDSPQLTVTPSNPNALIWAFGALPEGSLAQQGYHVLIDNFSFDGIQVLGSNQLLTGSQTLTWVNPDGNPGQCTGFDPNGCPAAVMGAGISFVPMGPPGNGCQDADNSLAAGLPGSWKCDTRFSEDFDRESTLTKVSYSTGSFMGFPGGDCFPNCNGGNTGNKCTITNPGILLDSQGAHQVTTLVSGTPGNANGTGNGVFLQTNAYFMGTKGPAPPAGYGHGQGDGFSGTPDVGPDYYIEYRRKLTGDGDFNQNDTDFWLSGTGPAYDGTAETIDNFNFPEFGGWGPQLFDDTGGQQFLDLNVFATDTLWDGNWHTAGVKRVNGVYSVYFDGRFEGSWDANAAGWPIAANSSLFYYAWFAGAFFTCPFFTNTDDVMAYVHIYSGIAP